MSTPRESQPIHGSRPPCAPASIILSKRSGVTRANSVGYIPGIIPLGGGGILRQTESPYAAARHQNAQQSQSRRQDRGAERAVQAGDCLLHASAGATA